MSVKASVRPIQENADETFLGLIMDTIRELLSTHHRECDELFAEIEQAISAADWVNASARFEQFEKAMQRHFDVEEAILFPAFEARTGMSMGPTAVMRSEHAQIRELMGAAAEAITARDAEEYDGYAETMHIMTQQHNMKEENVLYPMCDQRLSDEAPSLVGKMRKGISG